MFVNSHAQARLAERLPAAEAERIIDKLERTPGVPGHIGIVLARLKGERGDISRDVELRASNGDIVVAIVDNGEVTTVYYRRSYNQSLTPKALGVERVETWA